MFRSLFPAFIHRKRERENDFVLASLNQKLVFCKIYYINYKIDLKKKRI